MNTVQYLNNVVERSLVQKMFVKFANRYGNLWTSRLGEHGDWKGCEDDWLEELSAFSARDAINGIKKALAIYKDFPPTQGQVINLCLKESGVPTPTDIITKMIARDFNHPMVKLVYDKIGSWALKNGSTQEIESKTKANYDDALLAFRASPDLHWAQLDAVKEQLSLPPVEHPKIATPEERKGFKERMAEYTKLAEEGKLKLADMKPMEFDHKKIRGDGEQRADYEKYLLSIPEHLVLGLPPLYAYDRQRLLNLMDGARHLKEAGYIPHNQRVQNEPQRSGNNKPTKMYKSWGND